MRQQMILGLYQCDGKWGQTRLGLFRTVLITLFGFLLEFMMTAAAAGAQHANWHRAVPRFEPSPCWAQIPADQAKQCGFLVVPGNRTAGNGETIQVAVAIIHAAAPHTDALPLVILEGGPGGTAIALAPVYIQLGLNADRDLILVDQRGTFASQPALTCPLIDRFYRRLLGLRFDSEEAKQQLLNAAATCRDEFNAEGIDLSAYNTEENAQDIKDLRATLGYDQLDVYGVSYGTEVALTLARIDPTGVHDLVLDSPVPPNLVTLAAFWPNARLGFNALFAACNSQPDCHKHFGPLHSQFTNLVQRLEADPVVTSVPDTSTGESVMINTDGGALANWLVGESLLTPQFPSVPKLISRLRDGKPHDIAASRLATVVPEGFVGYGLTFGVVCSEYFPYSTDAEVLASGRKAFPAYPTSVLQEPPQFTYFSSICRLWNVPPASSVIRQAVSSDRPTLILTGTFDAITPPEWAAEVTKTLPNSVTVKFPGTGHDVLKASACARAVMNSFLRQPEMLDVSCVPAAPPLFDVP
jgi:pimeloyl-ACP methyl ester carboxylesterase